MPLPPPPQPVVTTTIRVDDKFPNVGMILTSKCNIGYAPYSYVWIPYGSPDYYSIILIVLHQHCIVEPLKIKEEKL